MSLFRRIFRCGCETALEVPAFAAQGPCCDACDNDAPCAWVVMTGCRRYATDGEAYLEHCTALIKECLDGCVWTSRWEGEGTLDAPVVTATCPAGPLIKRVCGPAAPELLPAVESCNDFLHPDKVCCWWSQYGVDIASADTFEKVRMEATSATTATLAIATRGGFYASYACDAWSCTAESTFSLVSRDPELQGAPPFLCVAPVDKSPITACDTFDDGCGCCDFSTEPFDPETPDEKTFAFELTGCAGYSGLHIVTAPRTCSGAGLPAGVSYPGAAPCCVWPFTLSFGSGCTVDDVDWAGSLYNVVYCTGSTYAGDVYCYDNDLDEWVFQGNLTVTEYRCLCGCEEFTAGDTTVTLCDTWVIAAALPPIDCCCPPDCTCEPPATLYADISSDVCGGSFDSAGPVELVQGLDGCWSANASTPNMPSAIETIDLCCVAGVWQLSLLFVPAGCGGELTEDAAAGACDPFDLTFTFALDAACCPGSGGTLTVVVTE